MLDTEENGEFESSIGIDEEVEKKDNLHFDYTFKQKCNIKVINEIESNFNTKY